MRTFLRIDNTKTALLLNQARKSRGLNQSQLAHKIKLNQAQVCRILSGKFQRPSKGLYALCAYLNVKPVTRKHIRSLSHYPELATCLSDVLDGSRKRERALVRLVQSARTFALTRL